MDKRDFGSHIREKFNLLFIEEEIFYPPDLGNLILLVISNEENLELCSIPSVEESKRTIFICKISRPLGLMAFLRFSTSIIGHVVGQNVIDVVQDFFKKDTMLSEINNSLVVLIPEILNPTLVNHYHPIDLC